MEKVQTADGSTTFRSNSVDETYHSTSGAKEESLKKFVEPCLSLIKEKKEITVLDVCFGLGYNTAALLDSVDENVKVNIIALENDPEIILKVQDIDDNTFSKYEIIKELIKENKEKIKKKETISIDKDNIKITLIIDDARKSITGIRDKFDLCFLDPFSPKKCPELWSYEFLNDIYEKMKDKSVLTTYSCARVVRDNLKKAGFVVSNGPCVGRRAPSTIARKGK
ncbi:MAG: MnmC family methyltransferase [Nanoarchaeota archaeon]|nr:MnmC family methyltransferase [Nanoarchaeota archaeon]